MNHVDPETLAAWSDGGLPSGERRAVESHLADCPQCRAMAAAFGRTLETTADIAPAVAAPIAIAAKWILPFAAAILITAGVAWKYWPRAEEPVQMAATPAPAPPVVPTVPPPIPEPVVTSESRTASAPVKGRTPREPKPKARDVIEGIPTLDPPRPAAAPPPQAVTAPPPPPAAMPPPPPQIVPPTGGVAQAAASGRSMDLMRTEAVTVAASPWRVIEVFAQSNARLANTATGGGAGRGGGTRVTRASAPMRWRANAPNSIERSTDDGETWTPMVIVGPTGTLTAGHSPGVNVCWFVGKAGVVFLSQAGGPFVRVTSPESVDLVSVVAVDHLQATVFTVDGRSFMTTDGGQTWRARF